MTSVSNEAGEGLVGQATSQLPDVAAGAQERVVELKDQGKSKLGETLDQRTTQAGEQVRRLATALRQSSEHVRTEGDGQQLAALAGGAADRIERFGGYLEQTRGDEVLCDVEDFARRRPWMVAGIGLLAGVAASRFLKASSERRYGLTQPTGAVDRYSSSTAPMRSDGAAAYDQVAHESYATASR